MLTVAIIGAGPLGRSLALRAARAGFRVSLEDVMPANLRHAHESIRLELGPEALPAVAFASTIEEAVREADLIIDCVPDELESKLEILWLIDRMAPPHAVIATPTDNLSIADLASCTNRPEQCVAIAASADALASAPDGDLPLCAGPCTSEHSASLVCGFFRRLGYNPSVARAPR